MALSECGSLVDGQGHELIKHGTSLFPAACYHDDLKKFPVPWHWHEEWEALIVTQGRARISVSEDSFVLQKGQGIFINSGILHACLNDGAGRCRFHSLVFHPRLIGPLDSIFWQKYCFPLLYRPSLNYIILDSETDWQKHALASLENAWQSFAAEPDAFEFLVRRELSDFLLLILRHTPSPHSSPTEKSLRDAGRIKTMLQFMQENLHEELSLPQIAQSAGLSESECLRCFHSTIRTTPIQQLRRLRIQKAASLLLSGEARIGEIAEQCGFTDVSYFIKIFREQMGMSPGRYRKENN